MPQLCPSLSSVPWDDPVTCRAAVRQALAVYPDRIRQMIDKILANADTIGVHQVGSVEMHYKGAHITVKLTHFV